MGGSSWCPKPKPKRERMPTPEHAAQIERTAQHLAELGCTQEQIARHIQHLNVLAARRAKKKPPPRESSELTERQIADLLKVLRTRLWRWTHACPDGDASDWVGHAITAVLQRPVATRSFKSTHVVGDALSQLRTLGLIERVAAKSAAGGTIWVVRVVPSYRVRLHPDEQSTLRRECACASEEWHHCARSP